MNSSQAVNIGNISPSISILNWLACVWCLCLISLSGIEWLSPYHDTLPLSRHRFSAYMEKRLSRQHQMFNCTEYLQAFSMSFPATPTRSLLLSHQQMSNSCFAYWLETAVSDVQSTGSRMQGHVWRAVSLLIPLAGLYCAYCDGTHWRCPWLLTTAL